MGEEAAKKINLLTSQKEKSTMIFKPSYFMAPTKQMSHDEGHNNHQLELQLGLPKTCYAQATNNKNNIAENPIHDQAEKTIINYSNSTPSVASVSLINTSQKCEARAAKSSCSDHNLGISRKDSKVMKRLTNRVYSKKYRLQKTEHINNLEKTSKHLTTSIYKSLYEIQQIFERKRALLIEHHQLRLQLATLERNRLLKEVEIENNMEEVQMLKALQTKQQVSVASSGFIKQK